MKRQNVILLVGLFLTSILLFGINFFYNPILSYYFEILNLLSTIFFIISIGSIIIFSKKRTLNNYRFGLFVVSIFFLLNLFFVKDVVAHEFRLSEIEEMTTCKKAEAQFAKDLKNGELKYFTFGLGINDKFNKQLNEDYDLEVFHMGCVVYSSYKCYNKLVIQKLNLKFK